MGSRSQTRHAFLLIPRGVSVLSGGRAEPDSTILRVAADVGSSTFGICSNPFLDAEFKTVRYEASFTFNSRQSFSYEEDTQLRIKGQDPLFHHIDKNTLEKA